MAIPGGQPGSRTPYVTWTWGLQPGAVADAARRPAMLERIAGIEPATSTLATLCSATELHPRIVYDVRSLNSFEERERASNYGAENRVRTATSNWKTRVPAIERHPQISERARPSRFHVLQNFT